VRLEQALGLGREPDSGLVLRAAVRVEEVAEPGTWISFVALVEFWSWW
jgi:hypothetical protein